MPRRLIPMDPVRNELGEIKQKVELYLSLHRFDAAEKLLKSAISDFGSLASLHNLLGVSFHKQGRFADALKEFKKAVAANPDFLEGGLNLVATLCDLSHYDEARSLYAELVGRLNPRRQQPNLVLGRIANQHAENGRSYEESGMYHDAIQEYRKALSLFDKMPDVRLALAKLYLKLGQADRAKEEAEELVRTDPNFVEGHVFLGILYAKLGRKDLAKRHWETARTDDPKHPTVLAYLRLAADWPIEAVGSIEA